MYFAQYLKGRLDSHPKITNGNKLAIALECNRATVSLWLSGDRYPKKPYLKKIVALLATSKRDRKNMILDIWELEDRLK